MTNSAWCSLAKNESAEQFTKNNNYLNWIASSLQEIIPTKIKYDIEPYLNSYLELFKNPDSKYESDLWLRKASQDLNQDRDVDVRISGPAILGDFEETVFANVSVNYPIEIGLSEGEFAKISNPHRAEKFDLQHNHYDKKQLKWLVPAKDLLTNLKGVAPKNMVARAARLLGLNNSGKECVVHFYQLKNNGVLYRPNLLSGIDPIRWACIPNKNGFGTTLDAVEGVPKLPEAVAKRFDLIKLDPYTEIEKFVSIKDHPTFQELKNLGFIGDVSTLDNPPLSEDCKFAENFRKSAQFSINTSMKKPLSCNQFCSDSGCHLTFPNNCGN